MSAMSTHAVSKSSKSAVLIFDGDCAFCTTWVERLRASLPVFPEARPYQWTALEDYGLSEHDVTHYAWYVTRRRRFGGHLAFSAILRSQPRATLRFVGWLLATPPWSWFAAAGYALIARYRHVLPGGTPACARARD